MRAFKSVAGHDAFRWAVVIAGKHPEIVIDPKEWGRMLLMGCQEARFAIMDDVS
jgi:hypothetical protein